MPLNTLIKCKKNKIAVRETNKKTAEEQERRGGVIDTCKHFEIGSGSVRSLSHLPVFVIEHLCRANGATNTKQIK
jgi:hypothetical protein